MISKFFSKSFPKSDLLIYTLSFFHTVKHIFNSSFNILIPYIKEGMFLNNLQIGILVGVQQVFSGLANIPAGIITDIFRKTLGIMLATSMLFVSIGFLFLSIANYYILILIGASLLSIGASLWHAPAFSILSNRFPDKKAYALGVHISGASAGNSLGPLFGGLLLGGISLGALKWAGLGWKSICFINFLPCFLISLILLLYSKKLMNPEIKNVKFSNYFKNAVSSLKKTGVLVMVMLHALRGATHQSFSVYLAIYLKEYLMYSSFFIGIHLALLTIAGIVFTPVLGLVSDKIGRLPIMIFGFAMTSLIIAMILFVNSGTSLIIMLLVLGSVLFSIMPIISAYAMDTAGKMNEGSSIAFLFTGGSIAGAIAPVIAGIFFDKWGFDGLIIFTVSLSLLGLFIVIGYTFYNIRNKK